MARKYEGHAIGIDLGTTNSCVAVWLEQDSRVEIICNDLGYRTTPSFVAFTDEEKLVGLVAKKRAGANPLNTVFGIFLFLTTSFKSIKPSYKLLTNSWTQ
jgi:L1 cell adhesion molecule like protein